MMIVILEREKRGQSINRKIHVRKSIAGRKGSHLSKDGRHTNL